MADSPRPGSYLGHDGRVRVRRVGVGREAARDPYFFLVRLPWRALVPLVFATYLAIVGLFGLLFWLDPGSIAGAEPGSLRDAFFFSVETLATIGYGTFAPQSVYGHLLVTVEAFLGLLTIPLLTGLAFAKFSRPSARVIFSRRVVIGPRNGRPTLMLRLANARASHIAEAQVRLVLVADETTREGQFMRRLHDLQLERSWNPVFALTWTVLHPIDETSPLHGETPASLAARHVELVASVSGLDETVEQIVHARAGWTSADFVFDHHFVDVMEDHPGGPRVNYARLHDVAPLE